jgi:hypothetical protein
MKNLFVYLNQKISFIYALCILLLLLYYGCASIEETPIPENPNPELSSAKAVNSFTFKSTLNPNLDADLSAILNNMEMVVAVPFGTDVTAMKPTIVISDKASITPSSDLAQDFSNPITYTVTAEDGSKAVYTAKVNIAASPRKDITSFVFLASENEGIGNSDITAIISGTNIGFTVPFGTDLSALKPTITHTGASTNPPNATATNFTNPVSYTVTAADGSTKVYTVTATVAPSPNKDITSFELKASLNASLNGVDVLGTITGTHITFTVPFGTDLTALMPSIEQTGANISPANEFPTDFTSPVSYTVTAADGSTKVYTATATVAPSASKDISNFHFKSSLNPTIGAVDLTATITGTNISIELPYGSDVTVLKPTITHTGESISIASEASQDFTNPVTYTVTAQDGSTKVYTVTVTVLAAPVTANVYVAGTHIISSFLPFTRPFLFENKVPKDLIGGRGATSFGSYGNSVLVINGDVYVAGYEMSYGSQIWKNGEATDPQISGNDEGIFSLAAEGNDLYAAGRGRYSSLDYLRVWKNGKQLSNYSYKQFRGIASGIKVKNGIIHLVGESNGNPTYWVDGILTTLSLNVNSRAVSIDLDGDDVYIAGSDLGKAVYWKNGQKNVLSSNTSSASSIFIYNSDIYIAGVDDGKAVYWKNGQKTTLSTNASVATSIFIFNGDVYVAGSDSNYAVYWKNDIKNILDVPASSHTVASSIFVTF